MSNHELLKLAAKAAGLQPILGGEYFDGMLLYGIQKRWNPLTDDSDALRLAIACDLEIHFHDEMVKYWLKGRGWDHLFWGDLAEDPECKDVRSAIVCAAAEIGRSMP